MFVDGLARLPAALGGYSGMPPASDRAAWAEIPEAVQAALVAEGAALLETAYPLLPDSLYGEYARTGNRVGFERPYFDRRRMLNAFALAECVEGRGRFLARIAEGAELICGEGGWQLPAHNSYVRGGPRFPLPDRDNPVIDLFAAETGAQLMVLAALLGAELDEVAPGTSARIEREVQKRIVTPYLTRRFWWMDDADGPVNNWTAWCTQNMLIAAFCGPLAEAERRAIVEKAARSLDLFVDDYGEDGACEEGVLYYRHAALCVFNSLVVLDAVAPGAFSPIWREPKMRNLAEYIVKMHVAGRHYINFGDSPAVADRCGAREYLFGRAVGSAALADFAAADWQAAGALTEPEEINLFYRVQTAHAAREMLTQAPGPVRRDDAWLPSVGLLVARDGRYVFAAKAGNNGEGHGHNDTGSVILYKDRRPLLIDVGVETYTAKTFSPQRYEIWTMQSAWHNLPTFGGVMQHDGERFAARDVAVRIADDAASLTMELAGCYPAEAGVRSFRRTATLNRGHGVTIEDRYDCDQPAELSLMMVVRPELEAERIVLPGLGEIAIEGGGPGRLDEIAVDDARLRQSWPERLYRVVVPVVGNTLRLTIV